MTPRLHNDNDPGGPNHRSFGLFEFIGALLLTTMVPAAAPAQDARGPVKSVEVVILSWALGSS